MAPKSSHEEKFENQILVFQQLSNGVAELCGKYDKLNQEVAEQQHAYRSAREAAVFYAKHKGAVGERLKTAEQASLQAERRLEDLKKVINSAQVVTQSKVDEGARRRAESIKMRKDKILSIAKSIWPQEFSSGDGGHSSFTPDDFQQQQLMQSLANQYGVDETATGYTAPQLFDIIKQQAASLSSAQETNSEVRKTLSRMERWYNQYKKWYDEKNEELQNKVQELTEAESLISRLKTEKDQLDEDKGQLHDDMKSLQDSYDKVCDQLDEVRAELDEAKEDLEQGSVLQRADATLETQRLKQEIESLTNTITNLQSEQQANEVINSSLLEVLRDSELEAKDDIKALEKKQADQQKAHQDTLARIQKAVKAEVVEPMTEQYHKLKEEYGLLKQAALDLAGEYNAVSRTSRSMTEQALASRAEVDEMRKELSKAEVTRDELRNKVPVVRGQCIALLTKILRQVNDPDEDQLASVFEDLEILKDYLKVERLSHRVTSPEKLDSDKSPTSLGSTIAIAEASVAPTEKSKLALVIYLSLNRGQYSTRVANKAELYGELHWVKQHLIDPLWKSVANETPLTRMDAFTSSCLVKMLPEQLKAARGQGLKFAWAAALVVQLLCMFQIDTSELQDIAILPTSSMSFLEASGLVRIKIALRYFLRQEDEVGEPEAMEEDEKELGDGDNDELDNAIDEDTNEGLNNFPERVDYEDEEDQTVEDAGTGALSYTTAAHKIDEISELNDNRFRDDVFDQPALCMLDVKDFLAQTCSSDDVAVGDDYILTGDGETMYAWLRIDGEWHLTTQPPKLSYEGLTGRAEWTINNTTHQRTWHHGDELATIIGRCMPKEKSKVVSKEIANRAQERAQRIHEEMRKLREETPFLSSDI